MKMGREIKESLLGRFLFSWHWQSISRDCRTNSAVR